MDRAAVPATPCAGQVTARHFPVIGSQQRKCLGLPQQTPFV